MATMKTASYCCLFAVLVTLAMCSEPYFVMGNNGPQTYRFGYDTRPKTPEPKAPAGVAQIMREESRLEDGTVVGRYGYTDPFGVFRVVKYVAGPNGYYAFEDIGGASSSNIPLFFRATARQKEEEESARQSPVPSSAPGHLPDKFNPPLYHPEAHDASTRSKNGADSSASERFGERTRDELSARGVHTHRHDAASGRIVEVKDHHLSSPSAPVEVTSRAPLPPRTTAADRRVTFDEESETGSVSRSPFEDDEDIFKLLESVRVPDEGSHENVAADKEAGHSRAASGSSESSITVTATPSTSAPSPSRVSASLEDVLKVLPWITKPKINHDLHQDGLLSRDRPRTTTAFANLAKFTTTEASPTTSVTTDAPSTTAKLEVLPTEDTTAASSTIASLNPESPSTSTPTTISDISRIVATTKPVVRTVIRQFVRRRGSTTRPSFRTGRVWKVVSTPLPTVSTTLAPDTTASSTVADTTTVTTENGTTTEATTTAEPPFEDLVTPNLFEGRLDVTAMMTRNDDEESNTLKTSASGTFTTSTPFDFKWPEDEVVANTNSPGADDVPNYSEYKEATVDDFSNAVIRDDITTERMTISNEATTELVVEEATEPTTRLPSRRPVTRASTTPLYTFGELDQFIARELASTEAPATRKPTRKFTKRPMDWSTRLDAMTTTELPTSELTTTEEATTRRTTVIRMRVRRPKTTTTEPSVTRLPTTSTWTTSTGQWTTGEPTTTVTTELPTTSRATGDQAQLRNKLVAILRERGYIWPLNLNQTWIRGQPEVRLQRLDSTQTGTSVAAPSTTQSYTIETTSAPSPVYEALRESATQLTTVNDVDDVVTTTESGVAISGTESNATDGLISTPVSDEVDVTTHFADEVTTASSDHDGSTFKAVVFDDEVDTGFETTTNFSTTTTEEDNLPTTTTAPSTTQLPTTTESLAEKTTVVDMTTSKTEPLEATTESITIRANSTEIPLTSEITTIKTTEPSTTDASTTVTATSTTTTTTEAATAPTTEATTTTITTTAVPTTTSRLTTSKPIGRFVAPTKRFRTTTFGFKITKKPLVQLSTESSTTSSTITTISPVTTTTSTPTTSTTTSTTTTEAPTSTTSPSSTTTPTTVNDISLETFHEPSDSNDISDGYVPPIIGSPFEHRQPLSPMILPLLRIEASDRIEERLLTEKHDIRAALRDPSRWGYVPPIPVISGFHDHEDLAVAGSADKSYEMFASQITRLTSMGFKDSDSADLEASPTVRRQAPDMFPLPPPSTS